MALISELNAVTADTLNIPLPTVAIYSRVLRENGLLSKKGRGRGAAHATPLDAARLLIALMATPSPSQAADCVGDFGSLVLGDEGVEWIKPGGRKHEREPFNMDEAYGLPRQHSFEQAFAAIVAGFSEERFARSYSAAARPIPGRKGVQSYLPPVLEIDVFDTSLGARIRLNQHVYRYQFAALVGCGVGEPLDKAFDQFTRVALKYERGIESVRTIKAEKLKVIARVVNGAEFDVNALLRERAK